MVSPEMRLELVDLLIRQTEASLARLETEREQIAEAGEPSAAMRGRLIELETEIEQLRGALRSKLSERDEILTEIASRDL